MIKNVCIDIFISTYKFLCEYYQMLMVNVFKQIPKYNAVRSQEISFCMYGLISTWRVDFNGSHGYSVVVFQKHFLLPGSVFF